MNQYHEALAETCSKILEEHITNPFMYHDTEARVIGIQLDNIITYGNDASLPNIRDYFKFMPNSDALDIIHNICIQYKDHLGIWTNYDIPYAHLNHVCVVAGVAREINETLVKLKLIEEPL